MPFWPQRALRHYLPTVNLFSFPLEQLCKAPVRQAWKLRTWCWGSLMTVCQFFTSDSCMCKKLSQKKLTNLSLHPQSAALPCVKPHCHFSENLWRWKLTGEKSRKIGKKEKGKEKNQEKCREGDGEWKLNRQHYCLELLCHRSMLCPQAVLSSAWILKVSWVYSSSWCPESWPSQSPCYLRTTPCNRNNGLLPCPHE